MRNNKKRKKMNLMIRKKEIKRPQKARNTQSILIKLKRLKSQKKNKKESNVI